MGIVSIEVGTVLKINFTRLILSLTHFHCVGLLEPLKFSGRKFVALISINNQHGLLKRSSWFWTYCFESSVYSFAIEIYWLYFFWESWQFLHVSSLKHSKIARRSYRGCRNFCPHQRNRKSSKEACTLILQRQSSKCVKYTQVSRKIKINWNIFGTVGGLDCFRQCVKTSSANEVCINANEHQIKGIIVISNLNEFHQLLMGMCGIEVGTVLKINFIQTILNLTYLHWVWLLKPINFCRTDFPQVLFLVSL